MLLERSVYLNTMHIVKIKYKTKKGKISPPLTLLLKHTKSHVYFT